MIGVSVSDIVKLLEQVPGWKAVIGLPKRLAELEARVRALEIGSKTAAGPGPRDCPMCGAVMRVEQEAAHRRFDALKIHRLVCDGCGNKAERIFQPGKGYR